MEVNVTLRWEQRRACTHSLGLMQKYIKHQQFDPYTSATIYKGRMCQLLSYTF